ncbi:MAG: hypothetical protein ACREA0_07755 [bacterium]
MGDDLAEALDLEPITSNVVIGCDQFAQVAESKGYCLDGKVSGFEDFFELATRLQGRVPTADERREFALKQELRELTSIGEGLNGSRIAEILAELRELGDD